MNSKIWKPFDPADLKQLWNVWWALQIGANAGNLLQFLARAEDYKVNPDLPIESIVNLTSDEVFSKAVSQHILSGERLPSLVWLNGKSIVKKSVFELGCGTGLTINRLAPLLRKSLGIDCSDLAIRLAIGAQTAKSRFAHSSQISTFLDLKGTFDSGFSSMVFTFLSREYATNLLLLAHLLLKKRGQFGVDFYFDADPAAPGTVSPDTPQDCSNCVQIVLYSYDDVKSMCDAVGFEISEHRCYDAIKKQFFTLVKK